MRHAELSKLLVLGFLFLVLLGLYLKFYFIEEAKEYGKSATTFSSLFEKRQKLDMPTMVFCMRPSVIPLMKEQFDYQQFFEIKYEELKESNQSMWEIAEKISYKLNRDYIIQVRGEAFDDITANLEQGVNVVNGVKMEVLEIATLRHGMCQVIHFNGTVTIDQSKPLSLTIKFDKNMPVEDIPTQVDVMFTSKDGWYGILFDDWPLFQVTKFSFDIKPQTNTLWFLKFGLVEQKFRYGQSNITQCFERMFASNNCSTKCVPLVYNFLSDLPICQNIEDYRCIIKDHGKERLKCLKPKFMIQYKGDPALSKTESKKHTYLRLFMQFPNDLVEISEEILVISDLDFLASVGGSLGLFLGFSFFNLGATLIGMLWNIKCVGNRVLDRSASALVGKK